ncbi:response regulator [Chitinispirillales bacterium ANBcel5]|uniref:response regulator n=1 Tax=Cellulosispirillum alkaliphilum TaxID=3039283 RepID=UPI002A58CDD6|nr:response regulator [Chitinispirillales bacterium ANBcel5]
MQTEQILEILKSSVSQVKESNEEIKGFDEHTDLNTSLTDFGFDIVSLAELQRDLEIRLDGRKLHMESLLVPETFNTLSLIDILNHLKTQLATPVKNPIVVYVDDEEENLFIFKRKFNKDLNLKLFNDPKEALQFVSSNPDVAVVITDEVMPGMTGNQLCDAIKKIKPYMKFLLITGNPENDNNLMYKSLRGNRFYDFIQKPVDFDKNRDKYLNIIRNLME